MDKNSIAESMYRNACADFHAARQKREDLPQGPVDRAFWNILGEFATPSPLDSEPQLVLQTVSLIMREMSEYGFLPNDESKANFLFYAIHWMQPAIAEAVANAVGATAENWQEAAERFVVLTTEEDENKTSIALTKFNGDPLEVLHMAFSKAGIPQERGGEIELRILVCHYRRTLDAAQNPQDDDYGALYPMNELLASMGRSMEWLHLAAEEHAIKM